MKMFRIEYVQKTTGYFGVEADTEEEALKRFDDWIINSEYVQDTMDCICIEDCDVSINDNASVLQEDVLTDRMYKRFLMVQER